jgi:hypothetical protein
MARSKITSRTNDIITDDGSILISLIDGEQMRMGVTLGWLTDLTGYTLVAKVVEADNTQGSSTLPTDVLSGGTVTTLTIIDATVTDNAIEIVFPSNLIDSWATTPEPDQPVYGYVGLEVADAGAGTNQQIWKPIRGLVEVRYSPSEAV